MGYYLGVDLGSTTAKAVVIDEDAIVSQATLAMGAVSRKAMERAVDAALTGAGISSDDLSATISTGYGRRLVELADRTFTEITCHARGVSAMVPEARLVIDIGGQDSKAIVIGEDGLPDDFAMNDRCASGTGRFYEVLARALEVELGELGDLALQGRGDLEVSSMCATFAETEIVSMMAEGLPPADIAASVHRAIAGRTLALIAQVGRHTPVVLTGGVARNPAVAVFLSRALDAEITIPAHPQITGAYGAALLARDARHHRTEQLSDVPDADHLFPHTHPVAHGHDCALCGTGRIVDLGSTIRTHV